MMFPRVSCSERPMTAVSTADVAITPERAKPAREAVRIPAKPSSMRIERSRTMTGLRMPKGIRSVSKSRWAPPMTTAAIAVRSARKRNSPGPDLWGSLARIIASSRWMPPMSRAMMAGRRRALGANRQDRSWTSARKPMSR